MDRDSLINKINKISKGSISKLNSYCTEDLLAIYNILRIYEAIREICLKEVAAVSKHLEN